MPTVDQIQAKINNLKIQLETFKIEKRIINSRIINQQKVLKPARNVGFIPRKNILNKEKYNKNLSILISNEIIKIQREIEQIQKQQIQKQQILEEIKKFKPKQKFQLQQHFDCCIFSSGYNQLKIMFYDNKATQYFSLDNIIQLININTIVIQNLIDIPREFGNFKIIRNLIETIKIKKQQQQQQ
jgi:hypothetical protein